MLRDRVFMITMGVSALVHLSMVTLFSIYVWVPVSRPVYAQMEIKYLDTDRIALAAMDVSLHMPSLDGPLPERSPNQTDPASTNLTIPTPEPLGAILPEIALPSLDSAQLERAEMIASSAGVRSTFEPEARQDSWARFIGRIGKLDDRLREYTPLESVFPDVSDPVRPEPIGRPAPGLAMYVEWTGEPRDRRLELGAPIDGLWRVDPKEMVRPISLPFKANARGEVVYVLPSPADDEILASVGDALRRFRFAPLEDSSSGNQIGTLVIASEVAP